MATTSDSAVTGTADMSGATAGTDLGQRESSAVVRAKQIAAEKAAAAAEAAERAATAAVRAAEAAEKHDALLRRRQAGQEPEAGSDDGEVDGEFGDHRATAAVADRPDEVAGGSGDLPSRPRRRSWVAATLVLLVISSTTVIALIFAMSVWQRDRELAAERELTQSAERAVLTMISPSSQRADKAAADILSQATGEWFDQFSKNSSAFASVIARTRTEAQGRVLSSGIEKRTPTGATVLVAAVSKVSNSAGAENEERTWRLRVEVVRTGSGIKVAKVEVVP